MIFGIFHQGSGLGNQLHRYIATRVLAEDKGYEFGMVHEHQFKGKDFMDITMKSGVRDISTITSRFDEKKVVENGVDIRGYDPEINFVQDNTVIDGEFQDPRYFEHRMFDIDVWLDVEPIEIPNDVCVIGFRGGEYALFPDLFLTKDYWEDAIQQMLAINPNMKFEVHTDDVETAQQFFPEYKCIHDIGINWRSMRHAKYAIIANSSFFILPRLLSHHQGPDGYCITIAPRYWARHNTKIWALPQNYYKQFQYI